LTIEEEHVIKKHIKIKISLAFTGNEK